VRGKPGSGKSTLMKEGLKIKCAPGRPCTGRHMLRLDTQFNSPCSLASAANTRNRSPCRQRTPITLIPVISVYIRRVYITINL
jgi:hypothetical protein